LVQALGQGARCAELLSGALDNFFALITIWQILGTHGCIHV